MMMKIKVLLACVGAWAGVAYGAELLGPGRCSVRLAEDTSYVAEGLAVPTGAARANVRHGIFLPAGGLGQEELVWKNTRLDDITSFAAKIRYFENAVMNRWIDATTYHVVTNSPAEIECQFQANYPETSNYIYGFVVRFIQRGADVNAAIRLAKYAYKDNNQYLGMDFTKKGANITATNILYSTTSLGYNKALGELSCTLKEGVPLAPSEIIFASSDSTPDEPIEKTFADYVLGATNWLARGVKIGDITALEGEISLSGLNNGAWTQLGGYCLTNNGTTVTANLTIRGGGRRVAANLTFSQLGADVYMRCHWAGHSYDDKEVSDPIGFNAVGVRLPLTNEANTAGIAIRNVKVRFSPSQKIVADHEACLLRDEKWVKLWPDTYLDETMRGQAWMGGATLKSTWVAVTNAFWAPYENTVFRSAYQHKPAGSGFLYTIGLLMEQQGADVWAKIFNARHTWGIEMGTEDWGNYQVVLTNRVDGMDPAGNPTLAISHFTAERPVCRRHTLTVGADFATGGVPVRLWDIALTLAPPAGAEMVYAVPTTGDGALIVAGPGRVRLDVDVPSGVALAAEGGTLAVAADRAAAESLRVGAAAALAFQLTESVHPVLTTPACTLAPGATVVLTAETAFLKNPKTDTLTVKLVTGCDLSALDPATLAVRAEGGLANCRVKLLRDADGDLAATLKPLSGCVMVIR